LTRHPWTPLEQLPLKMFGNGFTNPIYFKAMLAKVPKQRLYTSSQVIEQTGVTMRMLQWWDERGFLKPKLVQGKGPGGIVRQYTTEQLTVIERALILKRAGVREHPDRLFPIAKRIKMTPRRLGKLVAEIKALGLRLHC
jgi:hypothetical protein